MVYFVLMIERDLCISLGAFGVSVINKYIKISRSSLAGSPVAGIYMRN